MAARLLRQLGGVREGARRVALRALDGPLRALRSEGARRLGTLAAVTLVLWAGVNLLYDTGERPASAAPTPAAPVTTSAPASSLPPPSTTRPLAAPAGDPARVAAAWYAQRQRLRPEQVRPLQLQRLSANRVRVLVLADRGRQRVSTALVTVQRGPRGWTVP